MLGTSPPTKLRTDARRSSNKDQPTSEQQAPSVEETKLRIHRNRRRIYQQRYRKKLCGRETTYEEEVAQLGGQIQKLQQHRQLVLRDTDAANVVASRGRILLALPQRLEASGGHFRRQQRVRPGNSRAEALPSSEHDSGCRYQLRTWGGRAAR